MTETKGRRFAVDSKGLVTWTVPYFADSEGDLANLPTQYRGALRTGASGAEWDAGEGKYVVTVTYQGFDPSQGAASGELDSYEITPEWREEPIESHPDVAALKAQYGGTVDPSDGRLKFSETLDGKGGGGTGFGGTKKSSAKNPLFGVTTYPVLRLVATHSYVRDHIPKGIMSKPGTVVKSLPAGFEGEGNDKTWICDTPQIRKRGNAWEITERWKDVDRLEHLQVLYKLIKK